MDMMAFIIVLVATLQMLVGVLIGLGLIPPPDPFKVPPPRSSRIFGWVMAGFALTYYCLVGYNLGGIPGLCLGPFLLGATLFVFWVVLPAISRSHHR